MNRKTEREKEERKTGFFFPFIYVKREKISKARGGLKGLFVSHYIIFHWLNFKPLTSQFANERLLHFVC